MRPPHLLLAAAALVAAAALPAARAGAQGTPDVAPMPSVTLPPELDRVLRDYERLWKSGDAAGLAKLFAENGFVMQGNRAPVRGRDAIQALYGPMAGGDLRLRAFAHVTSDTVGYILGGYRYGDATTDVGKFTLTLRRARRGPWEIFSDMDNMNPRGRPSGGF